MNPAPHSHHKIIVLLIDDQPIIGAAVRNLLAAEPDITLHFCADPSAAVAAALKVRPTVILQDLVMPQMDGMALVKIFRANPETAQVPLIVLSTKEEPKTKAEAFAVGANDYLVKLPDKIELIARVRHHSQGYISLLERNAAYAALQASQAALAKELQEAADYVRSILPRPLSGPITTSWEFIPSSSLGGDAFGYHWLDDDHFAIYLLDVCGHGVGAALLSISVMNVLRTNSLPATDCRQPGKVLEALNTAFPMERQNDMYFTMWYGVFQKSTRNLTYASGGHPPSVLLTPAQPQPMLLRTPNLSIGSMQGIPFRQAQATVPPGSKLFILSDGTYELKTSNGEMLQFDTFVKQLVTALPDGPADLSRITAYSRSIAGSAGFDDDFSMMRLDFA